MKKLILNTLTFLMFCLFLFLLKNCDEQLQNNKTPDCVSVDTTITEEMILRGNN